jgi:hypothetical protein
VTSHSSFLHPPPPTPRPPQYQLMYPTFAIKDAAEKLKKRQELTAGAMKDKLVKLAEVLVGARTGECHLFPLSSSHPALLTSHPPEAASGSA